MRTPLRSRPEGGYTVAEMMVATGVLSLLGLVFFNVLNSGLILFAKNTAVNASHEDARQGLNRLTRDIHASVSVPQLCAVASTDISSSISVTAVTDASVTTNPNYATWPSGVARMAAGVSFQNVYAGPYFVFKDPGSDELIQIQHAIAPACSGPAPQCLSGLDPGMRLIIPYFGVEEDIVARQPQQANNAFSNIFLADGAERNINVPTVNNSANARYVICYYTNRVMYLTQGGRYVADSQGPFVQSGTTYVPYTTGTAQRYRYEDGEIHLYLQRNTGGTLRWIDQGAIVKYVTNPTPFYSPLVANTTGAWYESTNSYVAYTTSSANSTGNRFNATVDNKYVGVKLTAQDPKSSNRGYRSTATLLNTQIDFRSRICLYQ
jgi:hypothetical protein